MDDTENIKILKSMLQWEDSDRKIYALNDAIEALEKQTPKEVDTDTINQGINISGEYDIDSFMLCPNCKSVVGNYEDEELYFEYCPNCGQKLKYTHIEEE